ncbi:MAG: hypothetical protein N2321_03895 [Melioribacteraceae bacterium]|nr:hypothetical protein [Melioribacteraceae bacterium]
MKIFYKILFFLMCFGLISKAQVKTNIEIIDSLFSNSVDKFQNIIDKNEKTYLEIITSNDYDILKGILIKHISKKVNLVSEKENTGQSISFYIEKAKVNYESPRRENFLGDFIVDRNVEVKGNVVIKNKFNELKVYEIKNQTNDVISFDDIKLIENQSLPFTKSDIPNVPLISNLFEPIIVVGTLIVSTVLLFVVRSK